MRPAGAFEFTQAGITNIESVEVYKAPPPWMAPSTGGVINAVHQKRLRPEAPRVPPPFSSSTPTVRCSPYKDVAGPGSRPTNRLKPGASVVYSEAFLKNTLGLTFSYGESTSNINPSHNNAVGYTALATGTAAGPAHRFRAGPPRAPSPSSTARRSNSAATAVSVATINSAPTPSSTPASPSTATSAGTEATRSACAPSPPAHRKAPSSPAPRRPTPRCKTAKSTSSPTTPTTPAQITLTTWASATTGAAGALMPRPT